MTKVHEKGFNRHLIRVKITLISNMLEEPLVIFADVVSLGSFAAVARSRDLDPSKVSRMMAALEVELGVRLFHRTTRRLSLTDEGESYYRAVQPALERLLEARQMMADLTGDVSGLLRVTTSTAFGTVVVVPLLREWRRQHPKSQLELVLSDERLDMVNDKLDVALRLGPSSDASLGDTRLLKTQYRVCVGKGYDRTSLMEPSDLKKADCLLFPLKGFRTRWLFQSRSQSEVQEVKVRGSLTISNALALRQACLQSLGPALLADWMTDTHLQSGDLIELFPDYRVTATDFQTGVWAVLPPQWQQPTRYRPKRIDAFLHFLGQHWNQETDQPPPSRRPSR